MPSDAKVNVLLTSIGRRVELIRAFREGYRKLGLEGRILGTDIDPLAPAAQEVDIFKRVPPVTDPQYIPELRELCEQEQAHLVFPLIDPDIPILADHREELEVTGAQVAVVSPEAAQLTADKWETHRFLRGLGLPTPDTWLPGEAGVGESSFPAFIKPRHGSAGKQAYKVEDQQALDFFTQYVPDPLLQEYLPGPEITNDVTVSMEGEVWAVVSRKRIEVRWGEVAKGVTVDEPEIREGCVRIAQALEVRGPITVQCMLSGQEAYFTEINARFGGGLPLGIAAGVHSPMWYLAEQAGIQVEKPVLGEYEVGLYLTRFDDSFFVRRREDGRFTSRPF